MTMQCPNCMGQITLDKGRATGACQYCGTQMVFSTSGQNAVYEQQQKQEARKAYAAQKFKIAQQSWENVILGNPADAEARLGIYKCAVETKEAEEEEIDKCYRQALLHAPLVLQKELERLERNRQETQKKHQDAIDELNKVRPHYSRSAQENRVVGIVFMLVGIVVAVTSFIVDVAIKSSLVWVLPGFGFGLLFFLVGYFTHRRASRQLNGIKQARAAEETAKQAKQKELSQLDRELSLAKNAIRALELEYEGQI